MEAEEPASPEQFPVKSFVLVQRLGQVWDWTSRSRALGGRPGCEDVEYQFSRRWQHGPQPRARRLRHVGAVRAVQRLVARVEPHVFPVDAAVAGKRDRMVIQSEL